MENVCLKKKTGQMLSAVKVNRHVCRLLVEVEVEGVEGGSLELRYEGCFQLGCFAYRRCTKLTWGRLWFGVPLEGGLTKY